MDRFLAQLSNPVTPTPIIQIKITGKNLTEPHATATASRARPSSPLHLSVHAGPVLLLSKTRGTVALGARCPHIPSGSSENTPLQQAGQ